ncbi:hypothetical protein [Streptomyces sp. RKAG337]|nr:hypothetical protein [Streptomyces sp. RKAG337]
MCGLIAAPAAKGQDAGTRFPISIPNFLDRLEPVPRRIEQGPPPC